MTAIIWLFIAVGGLAAAAGSIWFLVVAFRTSVGWGLACMFIPFAAFFFLFKYWHEAKLPFLVNVAGGVLAMVSVGGLAAYTATTAVPDFAQVSYDDTDPFLAGGSTSGSDQSATGEDWWNDQADVEPTPEISDLETTTPEGFAAVDNGEAEPEEDRAPVAVIDLGEAPEAEPTPSSYGRRTWGDSVPLSELGSLIGRKIEIHTTEGTSFKAELDAVEEGSIRIKQRMGAGYVAYDLPLERVAAVRVKTH